MMALFECGTGRGVDTRWHPTVPDRWHYPGLGKVDPAWNARMVGAHSATSPGTTKALVWFGGITLMYVALETTPPLHKGGVVMSSALAGWLVSRVTVDPGGPERVAGCPIR